MSCPRSTCAGLAAGWDIATLNAARARLSRLKGGGIARLLGERAALALFISDVPGDDPDVIGSGLLGHDGERDGVERQVVANVERAVRAVQDGARAPASNSKPCPRDSTVMWPRWPRISSSDCATTGDGVVWGGESTVRCRRATGAAAAIRIWRWLARELRAGGTVDGTGRGHRRYRRPDR